MSEQHLEASDMFSASQPGSGGIVHAEDSAYSRKQPDENKEEIEDAEYNDSV